MFKIITLKEIDTTDLFVELDSAITTYSASSHKLAIDFKNVVFIDSSILSLLLKQTKNDNFEICLFNIPSDILHIIKISKLATYLKIFDTLCEVEEYFNSN